MKIVINAKEISLNSWEIYDRTKYKTYGFYIVNTEDGLIYLTQVDADWIENIILNKENIILNKENISMEIK